MRTRSTLVALSAIGFSLVGAPTAAQTFSLELESGPAWQTRNSAEVPNDGTATRFSLVDVAGKGAFFPVGRAYATWHVSESQELRLLYAPLSVSGTGSAGGPVRFEGANFGANATLDATYTFNSYRASYRWRTIDRSTFTGWIGFTAKIRDATILLTDGQTTSRKDNVGFVPLLHLAGTWTVADRWGMAFDIDGLAGGPGRAIDGSAKVRFAATDRIALNFGYRTVEGGADVDEVYNFAWLHYAVASISLSW